MTAAQKLRTGLDLATVLFSLFQITAPQCGSLLRNGYQDDSSLQHRSLRYPTHIPGIIQGHKSNVASPLEHFSIGPISDITFLDYPRQLPPQLCGPVDTEREWMETFAFGGRQREDKLKIWAFEKTLEVYDVVARFYRSHSHSTLEERETFHLAHGDLSDSNILIDPDTGAVTGIIDWEMAGFRPAWLAAVGGGWFNDDSERFLMTDDQSSRGHHADETPADAITRAHFRLRLATLDEKLFRHYLQGIELRALFYACCNEYPGNTEVWLEKYQDNEWSVQQRGPFPFDVLTWIGDRIDLEERFVMQS